MTTATKPNPRAEQAFLEYVALGPDRSLGMLAKAFQERTEPVPTRQLSRLKEWSAKYGWQARLDGAISARTEAMLNEAAELDADTFRQSSKLLNERMKYATREHADAIVKMRESVRKPAPKNVATVDVKHSGTIKHAHHDMSAFSDDEIEALAAIAERRLAESA